MPPITRSKARKIEDDPENLDQISKFATMYPIFVTSPVPVEILDELIEEGKEGPSRFLGGQDCPDCPPCIIITTDLDSIKHGSRTPMQAFESPFLGMTDDEVRAWMKERWREDVFSMTFAILGEDTVKNKTCRIGYIDPFDSVYTRIAMDDVTMGWDDMTNRKPGEIESREIFEKAERGAHKTYLE